MTVTNKEGPSRDGRPPPRRLAGTALRASRTHFRHLWPLAIFFALPVGLAQIFGQTHLGLAKNGLDSGRSGTFVVLLFLIFWMQVFFGFLKNAWGSIVITLAGKGELVSATRAFRGVCAHLGALALLTTRFLFRVGMLSLALSVLMMLVMFGGFVAFSRHHRLVGISQNTPSPASILAGGPAFIGACALAYAAAFSLLWYGQWIRVLVAPIRIVLDNASAGEAIRSARAWRRGKYVWISRTMMWLYLPEIASLLLLFGASLMRMNEAAAASSGIVTAQARTQAAGAWTSAGWTTGIATLVGALLTPAQAVLPAILEGPARKRAAGCSEGGPGK